jgi:hypothetical protein
MSTVVCLFQMSRQLPKLREQLSFVPRILRAVDFGGCQVVPTWAKLELASPKEYQQIAVVVEKSHQPSKEVETELVTSCDNEADISVELWDIGDVWLR